jgi:tRNA threonylcarbamoyladenosine biosynthesis protein TsaB
MLQRRPTPTRDGRPVRPQYPELVLVLALDTSSSAVCVALHDGTDVVAESSEIAARRHGELLAPMIRDLLNAAHVNRSDVTDVVVGVGPGPYTSLRIGLVTAHALGLALGVPVHGLCSLDAIAIDAGPFGTRFLVATDARRREVYWAEYDSGARRIDGPHVGSAAAVRAAHPGRHVVGEGSSLYPDQLGPEGDPKHPRAGALAQLAVAGLARGDALPARALYLRRPDATEPGTRKSVLA